MAINITKAAECIRACGPTGYPTSFLLGSPFAKYGTANDKQDSPVYADSDKAAGSHLFSIIAKRLAVLSRCIHASGVLLEQNIVYLCSRPHAPANGRKMISNLSFLRLLFVFAQGAINEQVRHGYICSGQWNATCSGYHGWRRSGGIFAMFWAAR